MTEIKKSYYAIIPANVRYDENLTPNAKLLYGEVTALCNEKGYCWASNSYFAELYSVSNVSISKWINQLIKQGYLTSEIKYKEGSKEILYRYLRIVNDPIKEKFNTPPTKVNDPIKEKFKDNNTVNNTINNTYNNKQSKKTRHKYGDNQNVLMTKEEHDKLSEKFPNDLEKRINNLSYYMASTGKSYKSHYMTIIAWARRDKENTQNKPLDLDNVFDEKDNSDQWARWEERKNASNR